MRRASVNPYRLADPRRHTWAANAVLFGITVLSTSVAWSGEPEGRHWAILIGVEKYQKAGHLQYVGEDVAQLSRTLRQRGNYPDEFILQMVDTAPSERFQPLKESIQRELPSWLKQAEPADDVLVYFSGHGFQDDDGQLYLAPLDCDPRDPAATGVPVAWLREQMAACRAGAKLLVIDACHAGSSKGGSEMAQVSAKDLADAFEQAAGVVTLASSSSDQLSWVWDAVKQSLFSFWLNEGLKGHADRNVDTRVDVHELYEFAYPHVKESAERLFPKAQTPVRIIGPDVRGVPAVIQLEPYTLKGTLEDMADQLATVIRLRELSHVGIARFLPAAGDVRAMAMLNNEPGSLGPYCGQELSRRLARKAEGAFTLIDYDDLQKTLSAENFSKDDLHTSGAEGLSVGGKEVAVVGIGTITLRTGQVVSLQCRLVSTDNQDVLGIAGGSALLNVSERAMLGSSGVLDPYDYEQDPDDLPETAPAAVEHTRPIRRLDEQQDGPHPLSRPNPRFNVQILVDGQVRESRFVGNDMYVPLSKDEAYRIQIVLSDKVRYPVFLRLLVDGLNTLPEKPLGKNVGLASPPAASVLLPAQRVNLAEAMAWRMDPAGRRLYGIKGFYSRTGKPAKYNAFEVVEAQYSEAARQQYTSQIGLITAAFYSSKPKSSKGVIGTRLGPEYDTQTETYRGEEPGRLLEVINIRYVEPEDLERILAGR